MAQRWRLEYTFAGSWSRASSCRNVNGNSETAPSIPDSPHHPATTWFECGSNAAIPNLQTHRHSALGSDVALRSTTFRSGETVMRLRILRYVCVLCLFGGLHAAAQQVAPDATLVGPLPTASGEYDLGAQVDNLVLPGCQPVSGYDCKVDVRAHVYYPQTLTGTYPVIIFLHGNNGTCGTPDPNLPGDPRNDNRSDYTGTGTCPAGYIESPSYLGYDYMAFRLASYGYIMASIDANRGITA